MKMADKALKFSAGFMGAAMLFASAPFSMPASAEGVWFGWQEENGKLYWYEDGVKQGTTGRGKEIYDPSTDGWYWLDAIQGGAKAVGKDVYQESYSAYPDRPDGTGKWVRYDENGRMVKGWQTTDAGTYYFEEITGSMAKGDVVIDGKAYYFDVTTGILRESNEPVYAVRDCWYVDEMFGAAHYAIVIKNNSSETLRIGAEVIAKDESGKNIGASTHSEEAVPGGGMVCLTYYFDDCRNASAFEYTLNHKPEKSYKAVVQNLAYEESRTDKKVIISCTNNGDEAAKFVKGTVLFFKDGKLVDYDWTYFTDNDSELKPGATITKEVDTYEEYDDVQIYFSGRSEFYWNL